MMYFYRIRAADYSGNWSDYSGIVQLSTLSNDNTNVAERFLLHQNFPIQSELALKLIELEIYF